MFLSAEGQSPFVTPTSNQWCPSESRTTSREASMTRQPLTLVFRHGGQFIRGLTRATFLPWLVRVTQTLGEGILRFRTASCLLVNLGEAAACNDLLLTASEGTDFMETSDTPAAGCYYIHRTGPSNFFSFQMLRTFTTIDYTFWNKSGLNKSLKINIKYIL